MLFATELSFVHPYSNESITIKAPLGEDMLEICKQLGWPEQEKDY
jgi:tRNA pseudouridine65 synthase